MTGSRTLIDSNILIYSINTSAEKIKREKARKILESGFKDQEDFAVAAQNLEELAVVATSKIENELDWMRVKEFVEELTYWGNFKILETDGEAVIEASRIMEDQGVDFWDSLIAAVMKRNGVEKIYTENLEDFENITGVEPVNPFK